MGRRERNAEMLVSVETKSTFLRDLDVVTPWSSTVTNWMSMDLICEELKQSFRTSLTGGLMIKTL